VYAVTQWAAERARSGAGPTLIEHVTYRAGAHSTSDDPSRYRPRDEHTLWPLGDPIERLKQHLIALGQWSEEQHAALERELEAHVTACWRESLAAGQMNEGPRLERSSLFDDVFKEMPEHLKRQREQLERESQ
jgi:2-oxoisovalerate dehydrogenase E1 component alpha subunit